MRLLEVKELPPHLQFNPRVKKGYRPPMNSNDCLKSICYVHNESFNIYSHGTQLYVLLESFMKYSLAALALCYFALTSWLDYSKVWFSESPGIITFFIALDYLSSVVPFTASVVYHLFMPHISGMYTYKVLLMVDVCGVWFSCTFGAFSIIYCSLQCTAWLRNCYLMLYAVVSLACLFSLVMSKSAKDRVVPLTVQFCVRVISHFIRLSPIGSGHPSAVSYNIMMDIFAAAGALINALHIPERWIPGKVDYMFNGHTLMHISAFVTLIFGRKGFILDMLWLSTNNHCHLTH